MISPILRGTTGRSGAQQDCGWGLDKFHLPLHMTNPYSLPQLLLLNASDFCLGPANANALSMSHRAWALWSHTWAIIYGSWTVAQLDLVTAASRNDSLPWSHWYCVTQSSNSKSICNGQPWCGLFWPEVTCLISPSFCWCR